ncbi:MAG: hypothetical protein IPN58_21065 [Anaerolineales bacterium]|nr:hypothetical protein [Anaerolineales bacterium]
MKVLLQQTIFKARKVLSAIHMGLFFGLITYAVVNLMDVLEGLIPGFDLVYGGKHLPNAPTGLINVFNLIADVMSGFLLIAITTFLVRRFIVKDKALTFRENVLLNPESQSGRAGARFAYRWRVRHHARRCASDESSLPPHRRRRPVHAHRKFSQ